MRGWSLSHVDNQNMDTVQDRVRWNHSNHPTCPAFISTDLAHFLVVCLHGVFRLYDARMAKLILECARGIIAMYYSRCIVQAPCGTRYPVLRPAGIAGGDVK